MCHAAIGNRVLFYNLQPPCMFSQSVQLLHHVWLFATPCTAACQSSLSITNSRSLLKFMSIQSVMPSNHFILCCPLLFLTSIFPSIRVLSNESVLCIRGQSTGAWASVLPINIQDWFPLGLTALTRWTFAGKVMKQKSSKCSTWVQFQWQNYLCSFPRQTIQHHSNPSICPNH